jgi:hypothetical protein
MPDGEMSNAIKEKVLDINRHIILNAFNLSDLGLFGGKMGIILYFYIFARRQKEKIYEEFASELFDNLIDELHIHIPFFFDDGLCGIGWGIEYLAQHNYIMADTNDLLTDVDSAVMQLDPARIRDTEPEKGLSGVVHYVTTRLTSTSRNSHTPFDPKYLSGLYETCFAESQPAFKEYIGWYQQPYSQKTELNSSFFVHAPEIAAITDENIRRYPLGLAAGLSGACLKQILSQ